MASRTIYIGDTFPDALFQVEDETGVLDLTGASGIDVQWIGANFEFSGDGAAVNPVIDDPDDIHHWNARYVFAEDDSSEADIYVPFLVVTWTTGKIQTFPTSDTLIVKAFPEPA